MKIQQMKQLTSAMRSLKERDMKEHIAGDYTLDFGDGRYEMNLYDLLNRALRAEKKVVKDIVKVRDCAVPCDGNYE